MSQTKLRSTWRPQQGQIWVRIDLNSIDAAAWLSGLRFFSDQRSIPLAKSKPLPRGSFHYGGRRFTGIVFGFNETEWTEQIEWLLRFRREQPECIVIAWNKSLSTSVAPLLLEAGASLLCSDYTQLLLCARSAIKHGMNFPIENNPILEKIQTGIVLQHGRPLREGDTWARRLSHVAQLLGRDAQAT